MWEVLLPLISFWMSFRVTPKKIDAPPYGILADTAMLASLSDITLYAVRSGKIRCV